MMKRNRDICCEFAHRLDFAGEYWTGQPLLGTHFVSIAAAE